MAANGNGQAIPREIFELGLAAILKDRYGERVPVVERRAHRQVARELEAEALDVALAGVSQATLRRWTGLSPYHYAKQTQEYGIPWHEDLRGLLRWVADFFRERGPELFKATRHENAKPEDESERLARERRRAVQIENARAEGSLVPRELIREILGEWVVEFRSYGDRLARTNPDNCDEFEQTLDKCRAIVEERLPAKVESIERLLDTLI